MFAVAENQYDEQKKSERIHPRTTLSGFDIIEQQQQWIDVISKALKKVDQNKKLFFRKKSYSKCV